MGVLLQSKVLFSCSYSEILGLNLERRRRFSVISACYRWWSQFCKGNSGSVEYIPVMK